VKYRAEIDGLRALAVLPVILFHAGFESFSGGYVGVDVFFVISGYLIASIIISDLANNKFSIVNFYERRARRLLPALFFVLATCLPFAWLWLSPNDLKDFGQSLIAVSTFSANILFWVESGYFDTATELKPLLHTWSLAVEEQYYVLFPVLLFVIWRLGVKWMVTILSIIFVGSLAVAHWSAYTSPSANFYLLHTRVWELLVGVFAAFFLRYKNHLRSDIANQVLSFLGLGMVIYSIVWFDDTTPFPSLYALVPTVGTGLLIVSAVPKTYAHKVLSLKPFVGIGLISYSAYLWHQPMLAFARHRLNEDVSDLLLLALCAISLVLAWFSWRFVERPFRAKDGISRRTIFAIAIVGLIAFISVGQYLNASDGRLSYLPENQKIIVEKEVVIEKEVVVEEEVIVDEEVVIEERVVVEEQVMVEEQVVVVNQQLVFGRFIDPATYTTKRHSEIRLKEFDKFNDKEDILIIGDSQSEDLVNAVFEAGMDSRYEFSSFYIPVKCSVLFIESRSEREDPKVDCTKNSFYNEDLQSLMSIADEIWIVSAWRYSDLEYIEESIKNIRMKNESIIVFGAKHFGSVSANWYRQNDIRDWQTTIIKESDRQLFEDLADRNSFIRDATLSLGAHYIDSQQLICDGLPYCSNFVEGDLISYDGSHFTPFGAKYFGSKLAVIDLMNQ